MSNHLTAVIPTKDGQWVAACNCKWGAPEVCDTAQAAEEVNLRHMAEVEKIRARVRRVEPSLKNTRDYYQGMADAESDPETKGLWQQLADEIDHRLNDSGPVHEGQTQLW